MKAPVLWLLRIVIKLNIKEKDNTYIANTYARFPIVLTGGKGSVVFDEDGKQYIDMNTGIAVNIFGLCDDVWVEAVEKQLSSLHHGSN